MFIKKEFLCFCMKKEPLVSIIIPTYNREKLLPDTINSVIKQTYKKWELIIVDDRSTDNTKELVEKYAKKDKRIRYVVNAHKKGPSGARNQGMELAKGKYIALLDSDDEWFNHHLKESVNVLENGRVDLCTSLEYYKRNGRLVKFPYKKDLQKAIQCLKPIVKGNKYYFFDYRLGVYKILNRFYCGGTSTLIFKKNILKKIGYFNENLFVGEDKEFKLRLRLNSNTCVITNYHAIYNEGYDNIANFKDHNITKRRFALIRAIKARKVIKDIIYKSKKIKNKRELIKKITSEISDCYFNIGFLFRKTNTLKALYYYLNSMLYGYNSLQLKAIGKLFIPAHYKKMKKQNKKGTPLWKALLLEHRLPWHYNLFYTKLISVCKFFLVKFMSTRIKDREALLRLLPKRAVVAEIGVLKGDFADKIQKITKPQKFYLIDLWKKGHVHFPNSTASIKSEICYVLCKERFKANKNIIFKKGNSALVLKHFKDNYFDWVYIDGSHSYKGVKNDLELSRKKVKDGGIITGHDYCPKMFDGVMKAVDEFCKKYKYNIKYLTREANLSFYIKNMKSRKIYQFILVL